MDVSRLQNSHRRRPNDDVVVVSEVVEKVLRCWAGGREEEAAVDVEGCILVNVTSSVPITGKGGLLYNVVHEAAEGTLDCSAVRADVFMPGQHLQMMSTPETDGGTAWKVQLDANPMSFEGVYKANQSLDVGECTALAMQAHAAARAKQ